MEILKSKPGQKIIFVTAGILSLLPFISPVLALFTGLVLAQFIKHPFQAATYKATQLSLKIAVVGLGFGMNAHSAVQAGKEGVLFTIASIFGVLTTGYLIGKMLKIDFKTSSLISAGTAICGGSAIAALSPVMKASQKQISVALGTIFILNVLALFLFPVIGHYLQLSQKQFGLWCAISIHDTSSVIAAAGRYGEQALQIATTVKLARALWIIPVSFVIAYFFKTDKRKLSVPYFIGCFILAILANTYIPFVAKQGSYLVAFARSALGLTLFLIGSGLSLKTLKGVGINPLILGTTLWILISAASLYAIITLV